MPIEKKDLVMTPMGRGRAVHLGNNLPPSQTGELDENGAAIMRYSGMGPAIVVDLLDDDDEVVNPLYTFPASEVTLVSKHVKTPWEITQGL